MRRLGVHTSIAGGLHLSLERAYALGCNTLQIFSHNPRGWAVKAMTERDVSLFKSLRMRFGISPVSIHTSYLINMASKDIVLRKKSIDLLVTEMNRADAVGADYVILHTGSAALDDERVARERATDALNQVSKMGNWQAGLLIENTAGERGDISSRITDLAEIMNGVREPLISGVCFDTCHAYAAGYDLRDELGIRDLSQEIEKHTGTNKIKLIHLNDSKGDIGSHVDRHEHIGLGRIGRKGLSQLINCKPLRDIPLILETPKKREADDAMNLEKVRKMMRMKR
jgi:deoxyribonuclease-4